MPVRRGGCPGACFNPQLAIPMTAALASLNYVAVLVVTIIGFLIGWLWYSPVLFAKAWMAEMKFTPESMAACKPQMGRLFTKSFVYTLVATFALAWLLHAHGTKGAVRGAEFGAVIGLLIVGMNTLNGSLWEMRSMKLQAINVGYQTVLFAAQGAILAVWH